VDDRVIKDTCWITRKFYAAANAVCCHSKNVQELSRLHLFEAFTLPILTYGCDGIFISRTNMQKMNVCWNNVFRKIVSMNVWESVKCVQLLYGRLDFIHVAFQRKLNFLNGLYQTSGLVIMAALCNRGPLYFCPVVSFFFYLSIFFSSPNLRRRRLDVYHTLAHGVALVRI